MSQARAPAASVAQMPNVKSPADVGVPVSRPLLDSRVRPEGKEPSDESRSNVYGAWPPRGLSAVVDAGGHTPPTAGTGRQNGNWYVPSTVAQPWNLSEAAK